MSTNPNDFIPESGTRPTRIEWIRETTRGDVPDNPSWNTYSDHIEGWWDWEPDANKTQTQPHGSADPDFTAPGSETHEATVSYWLQTWLVDSNGDAQDAAADAMLLSSDNSVNNTHSVVSRMDVGQNGADGGGYRVYHVGKGGVPTEVTIPFEVDEGNPVMPELSYQFEKFRTYRIDQPSSSQTLVIENNGSSEIDVTVEDEGAATAETLTVSANSSNTTANSYSDVDAFELSTDVDGTVRLGTDDGTGSIDVELSVIHGNDEYTTEGDLGVPALGSGSHASTIGTDYVIFNDDDYSYSTGDIAAEIISGELNVSLEVDDNEVVGNSRRNIYVTGRRAEWTATVAGEATSVDQVYDYLTGNSFTVQWNADEGTIEGPNAEHFSPGSSDFEPSDGKHERSLTLQSQGVNIT